MTCCWPSLARRTRSPPKKLSLDPGSLTDEQKQKLFEFRQFLDSQTKNAPDYEILRFLRARKWDVSAAVMQFQDTHEWRLKNDIDATQRNAPGPKGLFSCKDLDQETASKLFRDGVELFPQLRLVRPREDEGAWQYFGMLMTFGFDKEGRPIHLQKVGLASQRFSQMYKFAAQNGQDPIHKLVYDGYVRTQEIQMARMQESSERLGKPITQQVVIMDVKGLSYWPDPKALQCFKDFLLVVQRYYPETLGALFFLNAPTVFLGIWRLIKDWIDPVTASKMHLLGSDYQRELLEYIHPDQLPVEYGGTNSFDVFDWPQNIEDHRRRMATCESAAERLPGRKSLSVAASRFEARPFTDEFSQSRVATSTKKDNDSQTLRTISLFLSVIALVAFWVYRDFDGSISLGS